MPPRAPPSAAVRAARSFCDALDFDWAGTVRAGQPRLSDDIDVVGNDVPRTFPDRQRPRGSEGDGRPARADAQRRSEPTVRPTSSALTYALAPSRPTSSSRMPPRSLGADDELDRIDHVVGEEPIDAVAGPTPHQVGSDRAGTGAEAVEPVGDGEQFAPQPAGGVVAAGESPRLLDRCGCEVDDGAVGQAEVERCDVAVGATVQCADLYRDCVALPTRASA